MSPGMNITHNFRSMVRSIVEDLVNTNQIGLQRGSEWVLPKSTAGLAPASSFKSRDELIDHVTGAYVNRYAEKFPEANLRETNEPIIQEQEEGVSPLATGGTEPGAKDRKLRSA